DLHPGRAPGQTHYRPDATGKQVDESHRMAYWEAAGNRLQWDTPFETIHSWIKPNPQTQHGPEARWYQDGTLNVAENCLDRHIAAGHGDKVALYFEGEPGDRRAVTYNQLLTEVAQTAHALTALGIKPGDRVVVHLPVICRNRGHRTGLRPHRRRPLTGLWWILRRSAEIPGGRHRCQTACHLRRPISARQSRTGQNSSGRGRFRGQQHRTRAGGQPHRAHRHPLDTRP